MKIDYLLIGQGIAGTWLSYYLQKEKKSILVIDNEKPNSASRIAAGIINPVTGRRVVKTWMIEELIQHLIPAYKELGNELGINTIEQKKLIDFHPTPQMKLAFEDRIKEDDTFLSISQNENEYKEYFYYDFGFAEVNPCYIVNLQELLPVWRKRLKENKQLLEEEFKLNELKYTDEKINYRNIEAEKIIFCDGANAGENPFFKNLPFSLNKGEALLIESKDLPPTHIFKKGMMMAPLSNNLFWIGSNYLWEFADENPTVQFREQTEYLLKHWLKPDFKIVDHKAAIRPANIERRPFVGLHPLHKNIGIFNGMGTKGCSLSPYFAREFADNLIYREKINPEADICRFEKILQR